MSGLHELRPALDAVEIPAVINGAGSVFGSEPARDWLRLLEAIERPSAPARASASPSAMAALSTEAK